jgi:uncharacterized membrane protein
MQTWTVVRFLHVVAIVFFVGGQLLLVVAVAPALRLHGADAAMRSIARRFVAGSVVALAVLVATGAALASHLSLWSSSLLHAKLAALTLVAVLVALHVTTPTSRALHYATAAASLFVVWLGVKLTYG